MENLITLTPTATKHIEPVEIPDHDDFGEKFPREFAPDPVVKPGIEPVILPVFPQEEPKPKEAVATNMTQKEALAQVAREFQEVEEEEEASYQRDLKQYENDTQKSR